VKTCVRAGVGWGEVFSDWLLWNDCMGLGLECKMSEKFRTARW
jgi:hypothetical protein